MRRATALVLLALAGCGGEPSDEPLPPQAPGVGRGERFRPVSLHARAAAGRPIRGMRCSSGKAAVHGVHLELFAQRRVVLVAPGIGIAPPRTRRGAYVTRGRCSYPATTREPTGVIEVKRPLRLGDFFAIWGQPLSRQTMAGFEGRVRAYVGGRRWMRDPRAIPLTRHAQIVLEVGGYVPPHATYGFPPGL